MSSSKYRQPTVKGSLALEDTVIAVKKKFHKIVQDTPNALFSFTLLVVPLEIHEHIVWLKIVDLWLVR